MKKYETTETCTLKNIAVKIQETGCQEAKAEFFDVLMEAIELGIGHTIDNHKIDTNAPKWCKLLTKTEKRRNYLEKHGFMKEVVELKSCPFCGDKPSIWQAHGWNIECDNCLTMNDPDKHELIKAWNTRN